MLGVELCMLARLISLRRETRGACGANLRLSVRGESSIAVRVMSFRILLKIRLLSNLYQSIAFANVMVQVPARRGRKAVGL